MAVNLHFSSWLPTVFRRAWTLQAVMALVFAVPVTGGAEALTFRFRWRDGENQLILGRFVERLPGERFSVTRLSLLLSGFALRREDGEWVELPGQYAWIDAGGGRNEVRLEDVPHGRYQALRFCVGPDAEANGASPETWPAAHPMNPKVNGLYWSWQGGFIFLSLEGHWQEPGKGERKGYAYHFGRDENRTPVVVESPLDTASGEILDLMVDVPALLRGKESIGFSADGFSSHSRPGDAVVPKLAANLPGAFRLRIGGDPRPPRRDPLPPPKLPADNPLSETRVELGRRLFAETALSRDGTISCASCHPAENAFADPRRFSVGIEGQIGERHGMPLFNLAWKTSFFWDGRAASLREQALMPIQDPLEMGETLPGVVSKLSGEPDYAEAFARAFGSPGVTPERIGLAIESHLLTLVSHDAKFDRVMRGEEAFAEEERLGMELFFTERDPRAGWHGADCFHCHGGPLFTDHQFRNNGLSIEEGDLGRFRVTGVSLDRGAFATPSLRNIAVTAPYMHDGRFNSLEAVLDHYSQGVQRTSTLDPNLAKHPEGGLDLNAEEKRLLIAFLRTLTDRRFEPKLPTKAAP